VQDSPIPNQIIQPTTRNAPFLPFPNPSSGGLGPTSGTVITRIGPTTYTFGVAGAPITANQLQDSWIVFNIVGSNFNFAPQNGLPVAIPGWRIQSNTASSGGFVNITFYDPPIVPGIIEGVNLFSPGATEGQGFPFVPPPENSLL
jgi:hypothetical protein